MTTSMYCLYVGFDYTYIDVNALAQGIKSFLASLVWSQAIAGTRTYGTDSPQLLVSHANHLATKTCMYVCMYIHMYVCMCECMCTCMHACMQAGMHVCTYICMYDSICHLKK